ncbi:MAG: 50S ribosomal protein L11 methyltransferase [Firmicutes bacterium HGW-Firmicutes-12]|jgi:ribosomal protein L11 methyltransferase|nr:MAG: 50S ribosomal protein L11 methyltransferase [Firmicutes bacterium HGW-Firmicutes-12]
MEWQEISVKTEPEAVEAVSEVFHELGAGGVVIEDKDTHKQLNSIVKGYLPVNEDLSEKLENLKTELGEIARRLEKKPYEIIQILMDEEDWANSWKVHFKPLKIGNKIVIRPTWEPYTAVGEEIVLDLDPGMAFGTGSHASTSLCIRYLEKYIKPDMLVLDVGTGTGILAMCAARLGAKEVLAVDYDPVAVRVAQENIGLNGLSNVVKTAQHDLLKGVELKADLLVANIIADVILKLLPQAEKCLQKRGILIASGIIGERKDEIIEAAVRFNYQLLEEKDEEDWTALVFQLKE